MPPKKKNPPLTHTYLYQDAFNVTKRRKENMGKEPELSRHIAARRTRNIILKKYIPGIDLPAIQHELDQNLCAVWQCNSCARFGMTFLHQMELNLCDREGNPIFFTTYSNQSKAITRENACKNHKRPISKGNCVSVVQRNTIFLADNNSEEDGDVNQQSEVIEDSSPPVPIPEEEDLESVTDDQEYNLEGSEMLEDLRKWEESLPIPDREALMQLENELEALLTTPYQDEEPPTCEEPCGKEMISHRIKNAFMKLLKKFACFL